MCYSPSSQRVVSRGRDGLLDDEAARRLAEHFAEPTSYDGFSVDARKP
jgi:hypothetical protein